MDQQRQKCREHALRFGHTILPVYEFEDRAVSGTKLEREGLNAMLEAAKQGKFNVLYLYSLSRLARESVITLPILKKLVYVYGVRCICVIENIDSNTTGWEVIAAIFAAIHEQFIKELSAAVLRGQENALLSGYSVGDWCFGYGSEPVPGTEQSRAGRNSKPRKIYVINQEHAEWVSQIFTWYVDEGISIGQIVKKINHLKAPKDHRSSSKEWHHDLVVNLLSNPKYIGDWPWGEMQNVRNPETSIVCQKPRSEEECEQWKRELPHLRIIDDNTFRLAQEKLDANAQKWEKHRRVNGKFTGSSTETNGRRKVKLLHGLLKCAQCGSPFYSDGKRARCRGGKRGTCDAVTSVPLKLLESMMLEKIGTIILEDNQWFQCVFDDLLKLYRDYENRFPAMIREKERELHQVTQKIERLVDLVEQGDPPEDLHRRLKSRKEEQKEIQFELKQLRLERNHDPRKPSEAWLKERLKQLFDVLKESSPAANKALSALVCGEITLEENEIPLRKRNYFRGIFRLNIRGVSSFLAGTSSSIEGTKQGDEVVIDFIQPDKAGLQREIAKRMYDAEEPEFKIAEALGVSRSRVTKLLDEVFELQGEKKPDGRSRRSQLSVKHKVPPRYQSIAEDVMKLFAQGLLLGRIAEALKIDRNTVTSSVKYWHEQRGLPVPDGRTRRKSL
ncbi:recombinase family protein [Gimesia chilikensis]|uniref:recombinase family protein n=1 Tax=Gimesia chilikensis TaxID=2605989 RepID=UPI001E641EDF|nr:recombinase family protein [Gimesia chilikensis]